MNKKTRTMTWNIPVCDDKYDVIVIGGGPAGIAAAIASARQGEKTILVERYGCVGGMATVGLVGPFMDCYDVNGEKQTVKGILKEIVDRMISEGGAVDPRNTKGGEDYVSFLQFHHSCTPFDPEIIKHVLFDMLLEAGVKLKLHTKFVDAVLEKDNNIESIVLLDKGGLNLLKGNIYIDATGDADVIASVGNDYHKGRPQDGKLQPATLFMRVGNVNDDKIHEWVKMHPEEKLFESLVTKVREGGDWNIPRDDVGIYRTIRRGEWRVNTGRILNIDGTKPEDLTKAEIAGHRQAMEIIKIFKKYFPGFDDSYIIDTATQTGIRETRRIKGKYTLTKEDVLSGRRFNDSIARYAFFMDIHNPVGSGQELKMKDKFTSKEKKYFEIPYRCLLPINLNNLLVAGRCISSDHYANGAVRVMPCCFATGEAAGTGAALVNIEEKMPSEIEVNTLRQMLQERGCFV